ncbi:MAG: DUF494 family protein [Balneolaceae bacterium]|jgi:uncharacterized protein Smg (DUF494 family)|nr:MAG: DUF494 family protein [Balneolaceae bacterium]
MRTNVIDIIIQLMRHVRIGESIDSINSEYFKGYDKSEISAAYSWILQKQQSGDLNERMLARELSAPRRILHTAERVVITPEAHGYLLEMVMLGLIDYQRMEYIIEQAMLHSIERVNLDKIKDYVSRFAFDSDMKKGSRSVYLQGNESIN